MGSAGTGLFASPVSAWEIARKHQLGKLAFSAAFIDTFDAGVANLGWQQLPLTMAHSVKAARLPGTHKDPFDRMLAGQALVEGLTLLTVDPAFAPFGVRTLW